MQLPTGDRVRPSCLQHHFHAASLRGCQLLVKKVRAAPNGSEQWDPCTRVPASKWPQCYCGGMSMTAPMIAAHAALATSEFLVLGRGRDQRKKGWRGWKMPQEQYLRILIFLTTSVPGTVPGVTLPAEGGIAGDTLTHTAVPWPLPCPTPCLFTRHTMGPLCPGTGKTIPTHPRWAVPGSCGDCPWWQGTCLLLFIFLTGVIDFCSSPFPEMSLVPSPFCTATYPSVTAGCPTPLAPRGTR